MSSVNRQREISPVVTIESNPIYIQDQVTKAHGKYANTILTMGIMPAANRNENITKMLYSKFVVKGVRPINHDAIVRKLKENTQGGHQVSKKTLTRSNSQGKEEIIVRDKTANQDKELYVKITKNASQVFDFSMERALHRQQKSLSNLNKNARPESGFQRTKNKSISTRPQSAAFAHSASLKILSRPKSVVCSRPLSASSRKQSLQRPQTSITRPFSMNRYQNYENQMGRSTKILKISESNPNIKTIDYIQKNKRQASSHKKSIYLTLSETPALQIPKSFRKQEQQPPKQQLQIPFKRETVTQRQKQLITQRQRQYLEYMKEHMPAQYQDCIDFLVCQSQLEEEEVKSLCSCSLGEGQPLEMTKKELQQFEIEAFYKDFLNKCLNVEHAIKQTEKQQDKPYLQLNILNLAECQRLLQLYSTLSELKFNNEKYAHITEQIKEITQKLSFFRQLRKDVLNSVFQMDYQIRQFDKDQTVIKSGDTVKYVYVVLNGSVTKKNSKQDQDGLLKQKIGLPDFSTTLFDGEIFGLPQKNQDKSLRYSITAIERSLLMLFPYKEYRYALSSNQNIEDRIEILKYLFPSSVGRSSKLTKQDYETIAYQMQTVSYPSQQIIVREGQSWDSLIIVARGQASVCFQEVVRREKEDVNPLSKKRKAEKHKRFQIKSLRKNNMKNYELVFQNEREIHYYVNRQIGTKFRSDILNCKGFLSSIQEVNQIIDSFSYSLMSTHNDTRLYILSPEKFAKLSEHIRTNILQKVRAQVSKENTIRNQKELDKWQDYKIKICKDILSQKKKSKCY